MGMPGTSELILIIFVVLIIFGAGKLPSVFRSLGQGIKEFKKGIKGVEEEKKEIEEALTKEESSSDDSNKE